MKHVLVRSFLACAVVAAFAASVSAQDRPYVDSKAPCFRWPAVDYDGDGVFDRVDNCPGTPKGCVIDQFGCSVDSDGDGVCDGIDQCPDSPKGEAVDENGCTELQKSMRGRAKTMPTTPAPEKPKATPPAAPPPTPAPSKPMTETERQLIAGGKIRLENIFFETNSANLLPESERSLNEAGEALEKFPDLRVEVGGHTDTRGTAAYNQRLSQSRAESVRQYLLDHYRLRGENIVAKGYGETQPETQERNDEERLRNRRVELKVLNPEALPKNIQLEQGNR